MIVYEPNPERVEIYNKVYKEFRALYPQLKDNFKAILDL